MESGETTPPPAQFDRPEGADEAIDIPAPADPRLIVQLCLLALAVLTACSLAADFVLPIVLAVVLNLLLQPAMRILARVRLPRPLAALILIIGIFAALVSIGTALSGPATAWAEKLPGGIAKLSERMSFLAPTIRSVQNFLHQIDSLGQQGAAAATGPSIASMLFKGAQHFASGFFETLLVLFFLLVAGETFLRRVVEIVPTFSEKRKVVALSQQIEADISAYLLTITMMNVAVGAATAVATWASGLGDPLLWGGIAFLLNYVPIMGPATGVFVFLLAGLVTIDGLGQALLPAALYLVIHLIEGETVTPMLLARRFTLNPVIVIISLIFWFWMWGVPGAILAVPLLAIVKIICDGVTSLSAVGHFLEG